MATTLEIVLTIVNLHQSHSNKRGTEPEFLKLLRSPRIRFPAWRDGTTTLFDVRPDGLHRLAESIP
jgi:hypothetical protein